MKIKVCDQLIYKFFTSNHIILNFATLSQIQLFKYLSNKKLLRILPCQIFYLSYCCKSKYVSNPTDEVKVAIKSDKLSHFGGFFSIMEQFNSKLKCAWRGFVKARQRGCLSQEGGKHRACPTLHRAAVCGRIFHPPHSKIPCLRHRRICPAVRNFAALPARCRLPLNGRRT